MPESKYAQKLETLGFKKIDKELSLAIRALTLPENMSRQQKRKFLRSQRYRPWFTMTDVQTIATDETGQSWKRPPHVDLSHLKFDNRSEHVEAMFEKLYDPNITHH